MLTGRVGVAHVLLQLPAWPGGWGQPNIGGICLELHMEHQGYEQTLAVFHGRSDPGAFVYGVCQALSGTKQQHKPFYDL